MKHISNPAKLTLIAAAILMVSACSNNDEFVPAPVAEKLSTIVISDPYVSCPEGSVTVGGTVAKQLIVNGIPVPGMFTVPDTVLGDVVAAGCTDVTTLYQLATMRSDGGFNDVPGAPQPTEVVTPLTTMVEVFFDKGAGGKTRADATAFVQRITGLTIAQINSDPVANPAVQSAAAQVSSIVQIIAESIVADSLKNGATVLPANAIQAAMTQLVKRMETVATANQSLATQLANPAFITSISSEVIKSVVPVAQQAAVTTALTEKSSVIATVAATIASSVNGVSSNTALSTSEAIHQIAAVMKTIKDTISTGIANGTTTTANVATQVTNVIAAAVANPSSVIASPIVAIDTLKDINTTTTTGAGTTTTAAGTTTTAAGTTTTAAATTTTVAATTTTAAATTTTTAAATTTTAAATTTTAAATTTTAAATTTTSAAATTTTSSTTTTTAPPQATGGTGSTGGSSISSIES